MIAGRERNQYRALLVSVTMAKIYNPDAEPEVPQSLKERLIEHDPAVVEIAPRRLRQVSRRDFFLYGAGAAAVAAAFWAGLPPETQQRLGAKHAHATAAKERILNKALTFDDDVAAALYSADRSVPTYDTAQAQSPQTLRNNYDGQTPDADYLQDWHLTLTGLASGTIEHLTLRDIDGLIRRAGLRDQVTRIVCVEGWSAIAWWGGLRMADLMREFPPAPEAKWVRMDSSVNLDSDGNPDPYYVSIDMPTARHPQTLLATQQSEQPLTLEHGAPLRLVVPMKLGLKNIKAITKISYTVKEPADYWAERGYSKYDGL